MHVRLLLDLCHAQEAPAICLAQRPSFHLEGLTRLGTERTGNLMNQAIMPSFCVETHLLALSFLPCCACQHLHPAETSARPVYMLSKMSIRTRSSCGSSWHDIAYTCLRWRNISRAAGAQYKMRLRRLIRTLQTCCIKADRSFAGGLLDALHAKVQSAGPDVRDEASCYRVRRRTDA
jgi:hypothetical protein